MPRRYCSFLIFLPSTITISASTIMNITGAYIVAIFDTSSPSFIGIDILVFVVAAR